MKSGRIVKIISNRYDVVDEANVRYTCVAMGKLRQKETPVVGDYVYFEEFDNQVGIQKVKPRKNLLVRPSMANVDQVLVVMSMKEPDFSSALLDRLLFAICYENIEPIICITKVDLCQDAKYLVDEVNKYKKAGYKVILSGIGNTTEELNAIIVNKVSVLSGQSGAGKSSLINRMDPSFKLQTQVISKALNRGKHTTRHCELHAIKGGLLGDTPGFSSFDFSYMDITRLSECIIDFKPYIKDCKFRNCKHLEEPGCGIKAAVERKDIAIERYEHYQDIVNLIKGSKPRY